MFNAMLMRSRNKKGFTLMEMLIVVAIIAILVAVSFPVFTAQLEKARDATNQANVRAAKAVAMATYLAGDGAISAGTEIKAFYDASAGSLVTVAADGAKISGYGQGTGTTKEESGAENSSIDKGKLEILVDDTTGLFKTQWVSQATVAFTLTTTP